MMVAFIQLTVVNNPSWSPFFLIISESHPPRKCQLLSLIRRTLTYLSSNLGFWKMWRHCCWSHVGHLLHWSSGQQEVSLATVWPRNDQQSRVGSICCLYCCVSSNDWTSPWLHPSSLGHDCSEHFKHTVSTFVVYDGSRAGRSKTANSRVTIKPHSLRFSSGQQKVWQTNVLLENNRQWCPI